MAMSITLAAVGMGIATMQSANNLNLGESALLLAESGVEEAMLRLVRNPKYTSGTLTSGEGTATINVVGENPKTIEVVAVLGDVTRRIRVVTSYVNYVLTVQSQNEY